MNKRYPRYKYARAPIQEAIFEAKFSIENFDSTMPGQFYDKVRHEFPEKNDVKVVTITLGTGMPGDQQSTPQVPTMQSWNNERTGCLQIGPGIIAANILKYQNWENFTPIINLLLKSYFECARPKNAKRIGMRYINRFVIPEDNVKITDYFRIDFSLPETLADSNAFDLTIMKNSICNHVDIVTKLRFASDSLKPNEKGVAFLLDIDSFVTNNIPLDSEGILQKVHLCHEILEEMFESILQDNVRVLLGGVQK